MKKSSKINKIIAIICIILILLMDMSLYTNVLAYDEEILLQNNKNSRKTEQMETLDWTRDMSSSIGNIDISNAGKTVNMTGNSKLAGKNAIYIIPDFPQEQTLQFDYDINFGDSFNAAGVLLKVRRTPGNTLSGYMLTFNNDKWVTDANNNLRCIMDIHLSVG